MRKEKIKEQKCKRRQSTKVINALKKQVKGITLIALVVTIIVLLILAGVAISLIIGQNGIFTRAQTAVVLNENATVYERLQMVVADYQIENVQAETDTAILTRLKTDLYVNEDNTVNVENLVGTSMQTGKGSIAEGDVYVIERRQETASSVTSDTTSGMKYYLVYYDEESIDTNLGLAFEDSLNWSEVFANAEKHPEQSETNETIGIDSWGNPVNMDLWLSTKTEAGTSYILQEYRTSSISPAYLGKIIDGKIEGEVPKYIKKVEDEKFYPVTSMTFTFYNIKELLYAPKIPDTVVSMHGTFLSCEGLIQATEVPDSVIDMTSTFEGCTNLTGTLEINANPTRYSSCFYNAATADDASLILTGSSTTLQELLETAGGNSHISIQE